MSAISRRPGFVEEPLVGVAGCPKCRSVGTIVEMGRCCSIARLVELGSLWDVPPHLLRRTCVTPGRKAHG